MPPLGYQHFERYARKLERLRKRLRRFPTRKERLAVGEEFEAATAHHGGEELVRERLRQRKEFLKSDPALGHHVLNYQAGEPKAFKRLEEFPLIKKYIQALARYHADRWKPVLGVEDLQQEGRLGLHQAAMNFDYRLGVPFRAYAMTKINNEIRHAVEKNFPYRKQLTKYLKMEQELSHPLSRHPTPDDIARHYNIKPETARRMARLSQRKPYLKELNEIFASIRPESLERAREREELMARLENQLEGLALPDSLVLRHSYGVGVHKLTRKQLATQLGMSETQVQRTKNLALKRLRLLLKEE